MLDVKKSLLLMSFTLASLPALAGQSLSAAVPAPTARVEPIAPKVSLQEAVNTVNKAYPGQVNSVRLRYWPIGSAWQVGTRQNGGSRLMVTVNAQTGKIDQAVKVRAKHVNRTQQLRNVRQGHTLQKGEANPHRKNFSQVS